MANALRRSAVLCRNLGKITYGDGLKTMKELTDMHLASLGNNVQETNMNTLLLCEHFPVYTTGIRDKSVKVEDIKYFEGLGAEFRFTDRGGLITFHGPGQLMCYPILNLNLFKPSIGWYNRQLEEVAILTCKKFGVTAKRTQDPGAWAGNNKIAAIGFHVTRWITSHGLALNCNVDLDWFEHIVPCGLVGKGTTSLSLETWKNIRVKNVIGPFMESFQEVFNCDLVTQSDRVDYENKNVQM